MKKRILYGVANYEEIVAKNGYFIDKTQSVSYTHLRAHETDS